MGDLIAWLDHNSEAVAVTNSLDALPGCTGLALYLQGRYFTAPGRSAGRIWMCPFLDRPCIY